MTTMRVACCLLAALMAMDLGGCVYTPAKTMEEIKGYTLPADVMTGTGLIYVIADPRSRFSSDTGVFLDGEGEATKVGSLYRGEYIFFYVLPGHHRISMPKWSPYETVVDVEEGDIVFLRTVTEQKNRLIQIDGVTGRRYVMSLERGDF